MNDDSPNMSRGAPLLPEAQGNDGEPESVNALILRLVAERLDDTSLTAELLQMLKGHTDTSEGFSSVFEQSPDLPTPGTTGKSSVDESRKYTEEAQQYKEPRPSLSSDNGSSSPESGIRGSASSCSAWESSWAGAFDGLFSDIDHGGLQSLCRKTFTVEDVRHVHVSDLLAVVQDAPPRALTTMVNIVRTWLSSAEPTLVDQAHRLLEKIASRVNEQKLWTFFSANVDFVTDLVKYETKNTVPAALRLGIYRWVFFTSTEYLKTLKFARYACSDVLRCLDTNSPRLRKLAEKCFSELCRKLDCFGMNSRSEVKRKRVRKAIYRLVSPASEARSKLIAMRIIAEEHLHSSEPHHLEHFIDDICAVAKDTRRPIRLLAQEVARALCERLAIDETQRGYQIRLQPETSRQVVDRSDQRRSSKKGVNKDATNARKPHAHGSKKPLLLQSLKPITLDEINEPKVYRGRCLLCRTLSEATVALSTTVLVEDVNEVQQEVTFTNFTTTHGTEFPCGTIMVIKEPKAVLSTVESGDGPQEVAHSINSKLTIHVTAPSDVVLLDEMYPVVAKLGAPEWHKPETLNVDELRLAGNTYFAANDFRGALMFYERARWQNWHAPDVLLDKSTALLKLERFSEAYRAAKKALHAGAHAGPCCSPWHTIFSYDDDAEKALFRMGQSMIGFAYEASHWQTAISALDTLVQEFPANKEGLALLRRAKERLAEWNTGKYDFNRLYTEAIEQGKRNIEIAEFVGPIHTVEIPGKGRGLVASEYIRKGALLMVSKAIACSSEYDFKDYDLSSCPSVNAESKCVLLNEIRVAQTLHRNRQSAASVFALWAGEQYSRADAPSTKLMDTEIYGRIHKICLLNSFNIDAPVPVIDGDTQFKREKRSALHVVPAFVNHSCVGNAYHAFYGDVLVGHATRKIEKGDEITWSYVDGEQSLEAREESLRHYGFRCECELCQLDRSDPRHEEREEIAKQCELMVPLLEKKPRRYVAKFKRLVKEMRDTYSTRKNFRLRLKDPLNALFTAYVKLGWLQKALKAGEECLGCLDVYRYTTVGPEIYLKVASVLSDLIRNAHEKGNKRLVDKYTEDRDEYLRWAGYRVRDRSGIDFDIKEYQLAKGYYPQLP